METAKSYHFDRLEVYFLTRILFINKNWFLANGFSHAVAGLVKRRGLGWKQNSEWLRKSYKTKFVKILKFLWKIIKTGRRLAPAFFTSSHSESNRSRLCLKLCMSLINSFKILRSIWILSYKAFWYIDWKVRISEITRFSSFWKDYCHSQKRHVSRLSY